MKPMPVVVVLGGAKVVGAGVGTATVLKQSQLLLLQIQLLGLCGGQLQLLLSQVQLFGSVLHLQLLRSACVTAANPPLSNPSFVSSKGTKPCFANKVSRFFRLFIMIDF